MSDLDLTNDAASQAEGTPAATPATEPAVDPMAGLREQFSALGQDITLENAAEKVAGMRQEMYTAQRERAEAVKLAESILDQQEKGLQAPPDPLYQQRVATPPAAAEPNQDVTRLESRLDTYELDTALNALKSEFPGKVDPAAEAWLRLRVNETGIADPRYHFMAIEGERMVREAGAAAREQAIAEEAARNATAMPQTAGSTAIDTGGGITELQGTEKMQAQLDIVAKHMGDRNTL
jgi:hypothetical protein